MREIRFRAWIPSLKKIVIVDMLDLAFGMIEQHKEGIFNWSGNKPIYVKKGIKSFEKCSLMQYTGLKDKNGKEIYCSDLLAYTSRDKNNYVVFEVFWLDNDCASDGIGWRINRTHYQGNMCGGYIPSFKPDLMKKVEVIGNIYENPELLKENKKCK